MVRKISVPVTYTRHADKFALFNAVTAPNMPTEKRIEEESLIAGIDYPESKKIQVEWRNIVNSGIKCAIIYLDSIDLRRAMRKYPELFTVDSNKVWSWSGTRPMWRIIKCLKDFQSFHVEYKAYSYNDLPKNTHGGSSRSDATENIVCADIARFLKLELEWVGAKKRGARGAYFPDGIHRNTNGEIDYVVEVKGFGGKFAVNPTVNAAAHQ